MTDTTNLEQPPAEQKPTLETLFESMLAEAKAQRVMLEKINGKLNFFVFMFILAVVISLLF